MWPTTPFPDGEGIVVQNDSKIKKLSDLRGKKIAVQSGNPLPEARRCPRCLQPGFSRCLGDWDPFNAATSAQSDVRVLRTSEGLVNNRDFYLANKGFAQENPDVIKGLRKQTQVVSRWANRNEEKVVSFFSPLLKIDASVLKVVVNRRDFSYIPFTPKVVEEQQELADQFFKLKLIPKMSMLATWWTSSSSGRRLNLS
jgi:sulfonate transport system substrate-binding protein